MDALVGHTGFVGTNINLSHHFDECYNSRNIDSIKGKSFNTVVCSGIPSEMWWANTNPQKDFKRICNLLKILKTCKIKTFILISTAAVYKHPCVGFTESNEGVFEKDLAYGVNRCYAEKFVEENFQNILIMRLPALYGEGLKKNFIYDLLNPAPAFLKAEVLVQIKKQLVNQEYLLRCFNEAYVIDEEKKMFKFCKDKLNHEQYQIMINFLKTNHKTSLQFTNPDSQFQFYPLSCLWKDIQRALKNNIKILNVVSEPLLAKNLAKKVLNINLPENQAKRYVYDLKTEYSEIWQGPKGYLYSKDFLYSDIDRFFSQQKSSI